MQLLIIGSNDYTNFITVPSYAVNNIPEYNEWTDANYSRHRIFKRNKIQGRFTLMFTDKKDYEKFRDDVRDHTKRDGTIEMHLYVNNEDTMAFRKYIMDFAPEDQMPYMGIKPVDGFDVTVEEY